MSQLQPPLGPAFEHLTLLLLDLPQPAHAGPYSKSTKSDQDWTAAISAARFEDAPELEP
jgi:hypothetical protein